MTEDLPEDFIKLLSSVEAKRPKTVIQHILEYGFITNEDLKDVYGYNHPPRAIRDVRELGIPIITYRITDSTGRKINFKNTIIIMTSNIGARLITENIKLGFGDNKSNEDNKKIVMSELKKEFKPEFINRIDEIIVFNKLREEDIVKILKPKMINMNFTIKEILKIIADHIKILLTLSLLPET